MGAPAGPTGCNSGSKSTTKSETTPPPVRGVQVAAGYGRVWSHLRFEDESNRTLTQQSVVGQLGYFFTEKWLLSASGGATLGGTLTGGGETLDLGTGFIVSLRGTWQFLSQKGARPFASIAIAVSFARSPFEREDGSSGYINGSDVRFAFTVGYTLFDVWQLYLSPRVFGGPVFISDDDASLQGRDRYFVQAGMGMGFLLPKGFTIYIDGSPAGEQAISAGLAMFIPTS